LQGDLFAQQRTDITDSRAVRTIALGAIDMEATLACLVRLPVSRASIAFGKKRGIESRTPAITMSRGGETHSAKCME
jgi:hypothetical protein